MFAKEPDEDSEWLGKLYKGGVATAVGTEGDYTLIRSGSVEGYVLTDQLYTRRGSQRVCITGGTEAGDCYSLRVECTKWTGNRI